MSVAAATEVAAVALLEGLGQGKKVSLSRRSEPLSKSQASYEYLSSEKNWIALSVR